MNPELEILTRFFSITGAQSIIHFGEAIVPGHDHDAVFSYRKAFAIFFCILPSLFVVTVGPVAMKIVRELLPMMMAI